MLGARYDAARTDYERVLKQRNALLRGGVRDDDAAHDPRRVRRPARARGDRAGARAGCGWSTGWRRVIAEAYARAGRQARSVATAATRRSGARRRSTDDDAATIEAQLRAALERRRRAETRPWGHTRRPAPRRAAPRDRRARSAHAGVAGRAAHARARAAARGPRVVTDVTETAPVLLLDDVFSELDGARAAALVRNLPRRPDAADDGRRAAGRASHPEHRLLRRRAAASPRSAR